MTCLSNPELAEHVATYAAERGDAELEQMCDDVLAGLTEENLLLAVVSGDPELQEAVERGRNAGWRSRRAAEDLAATRAHFDIGEESEICMCGHHRVKHGTVACLMPGCNCKGFVSQRAARMLQAGFERATQAITGRPYAEVAAETAPDPAPDLVPAPAAEVIERGPKAFAAALSSPAFGRLIKEHLDAEAKRTERSLRWILGDAEYEAMRARIDRTPSEPKPGRTPSSIDSRFASIVPPPGIYRLREQVYRIRYNRERRMAVDFDGVSWPIDLGESG